MESSSLEKLQTKEIKKRSYNRKMRDILQCDNADGEMLHWEEKKEEKRKSWERKKTRMRSVACGD
jgi:hypothetical protein